MLARRFAIPVLAIVIPMSIVLVGLEIALRILGFTSPVINPQMFVVNRDDDLLPYLLRPGFRGGYAGGRVHIDGEGNRFVPVDGSIDERALSGEIVLLGDSVAFGQGLHDENTIAAQLQMRLVERGVLRRVSLIAAPGYTTWNEYTALGRYHNIAAVKAVVLIYVSNDVTFDNDRFKFGVHGERIYFMTQDWLRKSLNTIYEHSRLAFLLSDSLKRILAMARDNTPSAGQDQVDPRALAYSLDAVQRINEFCRLHGAYFVVALSREAAIYRQPERIAAYEHALSSGLQTMGVDHFILRRATDELSEKAFAVSWNDGHPSSRASALTAAEISVELGKRGH